MRNRVFLAFCWFLWAGIYNHALAQSSSQSYILEKADSCFESSNYRCAFVNYQQYLKSRDKGTAPDSSLLYVTFQTAESIYLLGQMDSAAFYYQSLLDLSSRVPSKYYEAQAKTGLSHVQWRKGANVLAMENIVDAVDIFLSLNDTVNLIKSSNILSGIYVSLEKYEDASQLYNRSLLLAINSGDSAMIAQCYEYRGIIAYFLQNMVDAIAEYKRSLAINKALQQPVAMAINYGNIGEAYLELNELSLALENLRKATALMETYDFKSGLIFCYYNIGRIHFYSKKPADAIKAYQKSVKLMNETGELRERNTVNKWIAESFAALDDYQNAYLYHQKFAQDKDSLFTVDKEKQLEEIKAAYNLEKKEKENQELIYQNKVRQEELASKQDLIWLQSIFGGVVLILFVVVSVLAYKLYRTKQTLSRANETKNKLFGIIAHDLKGPVGNLNSIIGFMKDDAFGEDSVKYLSYLDNIGKSMSHLINQLLSWTFTQSGNFDFNPKQVNISNIFETSVRLFDYSLRKKHIRVINQIPKDLEVYADENAMLTIFRNVLSNAIKFTEMTGEIFVSAEALKENKVQIKVKDSGVGIDELRLEKINQGIGVSSSSGTESEKGSGLGFSIIREFVQASEGELTLLSTVNEGTEVVLILPRSKAQ